MTDYARAAMANNKGALGEAQIIIAADHPIRAAIEDVRENESATDWCLAKLTDDMAALEVVGSGTGGVAALAAKLEAGSAYYGLARTSENIDKTVAVKFCFITFIGEGVSPLKKGKITTYKGSVTEVFEPFHVELLNATSVSEVTEGAIVELLNSMFGTAKTLAPVDVSDTMRMPGGRAVPVVKKNVVAARTGVAVKQEVGLPDGLAEAILSVRSNDEAINWCLAGFDFGDKAMPLVIVGSGTGGVAELASKLQPDGAYYGFVRTSENIDKTVAVKFCFITFIGESVSPLKKGKITTLKGTITEAFEPFHCELMGASTAEEVTDAAIERLLSSIAGNVMDAVSDGHMRIGQKMVNVSQHKAGPSAQERVQASGLKAMTARGETAATGFESARQTTEVSAAVRDALALVRKDDDPTSWCVLGYDDAKQPALTVVGTGEGSAEAMHGSLSSSLLLYGLVRVSQQIDNSTTVKFVLVSWVGEEVAPMRKAKLSTLRGAATEVLSPFHAELLNVADAKSVTHDSIMALLAAK